MPAKDELGFVHHLDKLAQLCYSLKLKGEALNLHRRSLTLKHDWWGRRHLGRAVNLEGIADICYELGDFETAEFDYMEAITLRETYLLKNFDSMSVIDRRERKQRRTVLLKALTTINSLAQIYADRGSFSECEFQYKRALDLLQTAVVPINQPLIEINALLLKNYRALLIKMNKANRKPALHSAGAAVRMSRSEPQKKKFVSGASYGEKF